MKIMIVDLEIVIGRAPAILGWACLAPWSQDEHLQYFRPLPPT